MLLSVLRGPQPGQVFPLAPGDNSAGRAGENAIHLPSTHVSSRHCSFALRDGVVTVQDLGSTNGVYVEGHRVREAVLAVGQRVQVGDWLLQLVEPPRAVAPAERAPERSVTRPSPVAPPPPVPVPPPPASAPVPPVPAAPAAFGSAPSSGFGSGGFGFGLQAPQAHEPHPQDPRSVTSDVPPAPAAGPAPQATAALPAGHAGFAPGGFGFGGASVSEVQAAPAGLSGFGGLPIEPGAQQSQALPEGLPGKVAHAWQRVRRLPWGLQLAGIMVATGLLLLLAPAGGVLSQVLNARNVAEIQVLERGKALALALASRNVGAIAEQNNLKLDADFLMSEPGVKLAEITDEAGVVRAPPEKVRQTIGGKDFFAEANVRGRTIVWRKGGGQWHILAPIRVAHVDGAPASIMGWAYLVFDVDSAVAASSPVMGRFAASLVVLSFLLGGAGVATWRLATAPVRAVREDLELCLRGHLAQVAVPPQWPQLRELAHSINRLITRWKKGERGAAPAGPDPAALQAVVLDMPVPVFLVDAERRILEVSQAACAWLGTAREGLVGRGIDQVLPDPAFLDTLARTCARVGAGEAVSVSQTTRIGANRVALRAVAAGPSGVVAVVAVG